jgi:hypothetical protein
MRLVFASAEGEEGGKGEEEERGGGRERERRGRGGRG